MIGNNRNNHAIVLLCMITIAITVLTQVPSLATVVRPLMYVLWVLLLCAGVISNSFRIPLNRFLILYIITVFILGFECIILSNSHSDSYAMQIVPLPLVCYIAGLLIAQKADETLISNNLLTFYAVSFLMFSYIFYTYIGSFRTWYTANYYIYEQKNSAAQIIGCTILLSAFLIQPRAKWMNVGKNISLALLFLIIIAMQCRTALFSLLITATLYYFTVLHGKRKVIVTAILVGAIIAVINSDVLSQYVYKAFVFNERKTRNLDYFTSGRLTYFTNAWGLFVEHPLVGTGHHRVDDLYLCILSDVGLVGFIPIIVLWIDRIVRNITAFFKNRTPFTACLMCLTIFYFSESIFEAYPPFGPGVCAFMFWIVCAFSDMGFGRIRKMEHDI